MYVENYLSYRVRIVAMKNVDVCWKLLKLSCENLSVDGQTDKSDSYRTPA